MRLAILLLCIPVSVFSQALYEGKVLDKETGSPVSFASIGIVGTSKGTVSNIDGDFSMTVPGNTSIKITSVGYESLEATEPAADKVYRMQPSNTRLQDLTFFGNEVDGERIVMRALRDVKKNMYTKPFVQKFFYRHYCKEDTVYGRLIEGAVEVYKKKGYKVQRTHAGHKEEIRVTQIRRSFDRTLVANAHMPIALTMTLEVDPAGYQMKGKDYFVSMFGYVSTLKTYRKQYDFKVEGISSYDGKDVYVVSYKSKPGATLGGYATNGQSGSLYVVTKTFAIVKAETLRTGRLDTARTTVFYKEWNGKYFPYHTVRDGKSYYPRQDFNHYYHVELMSSEIVTGGFEKFKGKSPDRESLMKIPFNAAFWDTYPMVKTTPLEESIIHDLGGGKSLNEQFTVFQQQETEALDKARIGEKNFLKFREDGRGKRILYVDFWASWCGPCLAEIAHQKKLAADYAGKITFVMLSIDKEEKDWQKAISKFQLGSAGIVHYRIGPEADISKFYITKGIPLYVLIDRNGEHFSIDAKRPSDPALRQDLDTLLKSSIDK